MTFFTNIDKLKEDVDEISPNTSSKSKEKKMYKILIIRLLSCRIKANYPLMESGLTGGCPTWGSF